MADPQSKQRKTKADKSLQQKVQNLPLLCVESICKFTPTSQLIRLYSKAVPLPGAFWNIGVEVVLKKRLPFSLTDDLPYHQAHCPAAIFDATGANVASIRRPEAFRFSPVRELIESISLTAYAFAQNNTLDGMQVYVAQGEALLSHLANVTELTLRVRNERRGFRLKKKDLLEPVLKHLLSWLHSLTVRHTFFMNMDAYEEKQFNWALSAYLCGVAMPQMNSLRLLDLSQKLFSYVVHRASGNSTIRRSVRRVLSGLSSLAAWQIHFSALNLGGMLCFVSVHCRYVSALSVLVQGDFKDYLAAFRAMPSLASLGLYLRVQHGMSGPTCKERGAIGSVLDLRFIVDNPYSSNSANVGSCVIAIASLFPNSKALAFQVGGEDCRAELELAAEICTRRVLPAIEKLSIFYLGTKSDCEHLADFIGNSNLPGALDLSQIVFASLSKDSKLLTEIYRAMQSNSTKSLLLRGPVHANGLSELKSYVGVNDENAKVTAWKDRDLGVGEQRHILFREMPQQQQTDFKIVGTKIAGSLKGEQFTIRLMHQFTRESRIFKFESTVLTCRGAIYSELFSNGR